MKNLTLDKKKAHGNVYHLVQTKKGYYISMVIKLLFLEIHIVIKEFPVKNISDKDEDDLAANEAIELFDNIINPYKYNG